MQAPEHGTQALTTQSLHVVSGPGSGTRVPLDRPELWLGWDSPFLHPASDSGLSRRHALLRRTSQGAWVIQDMGSTNGTYVNDVRISGPTVVSPGDEICLGMTRLRLVGDPMAARTSVLPPSGAAATSPDPAQAIERGRRMYAERRYEDAERLFAQVAGKPPYQAEGHFGLGMIRYARGDPVGAEQFFRRCLDLGSRHAGARYMLGVLAEQRGDLAGARARYQDALAAQPDQPEAATALARLGGTPASRPEPTRTPSPPPATRSSSVPNHVAEAYGVYEYLSQDPSPLSRRTLRTMDALRLRRHPSVTAYLGPILGWVAALMIAVLLVRILTTNVAVQGADELALWSERVGFAVVLIGVAALALYLVRILTTRFTLERGRLQIEQGIFHRKLTNLELWRVESIELHRTLLQRMTRDGKLVIEEVHKSKKPLEVVGLARGSELRQIYQEVLNLVFLLRGNPVVKGIIT
ncbi:FHA domain-containing protein [Streptomyces sp. NPDC127197]|uniref:FHA domain-containing protein n=1 Tax=Streptomyces sp. NPDC127197 TaxID=3345388 RepID=UPI003632918B